MKYHRQGICSLNWRRPLSCIAVGVLLLAGCSRMPKECRKYSDKELLGGIAFWYSWCAEGFYNCYLRCPRSMDELMVYLHGDYGIMSERGCDKLFLDCHWDDFKAEGNDTIWVLYYRGDTLNYNIYEPWSDKRLLIDYMGARTTPKWFDREGRTHLIEGEVRDQLRFQIASLIERLGYGVEIDNMVKLGDVFDESDFEEWFGSMYDRPAHPLFRYDTVAGLSLHPLFRERFTGIDSLYLAGLEEIAAACFSLYHADSLWFPALIPAKR